MKLKEWMEFNKPFMDCDFRVKLYEGKHNKDRCIINSIVDWDICERIFGEYEIEHLAIGEYDSGNACFKLVLCEEAKHVDIDEEMNDLGIRKEVYK